MQPLEVLRLHLEERVSQIEVEDEEKVIKGRLDLLAVNQTIRSRDDSPFWVLLIEAKNSEIATSAGLAQLLVYAHEALQRQEQVWGLVTNGLDYQFVRLVMEGQLRYELLPQLHFMDQQPGVEVVRVLKAIRMVMS